MGTDYSVILIFNLDSSCWGKKKKKKDSTASDWLRRGKPRSVPQTILYVARDTPMSRQARAVRGAITLNGYGWGAAIVGS